MKRFLIAAAAACAVLPALAQTVSNATFVNGLTLSGAALDLSSGSEFDRRVGYFSDLYYDRARNEWWGLSDRGPGGGTLPYETRVQRFTLDVDANSGAISNFQIVQTVKFSDSGQAFSGLAPTTPGVLGRSFDPEGFVINPVTGRLLVTDEYGPSLKEFDRNGQLVRSYATPADLVPRVGGSADYSAAPPTLSSGREPNRGLEALAISPDGRYAYAVLQNGTVQDGWTAASRGTYTRIVKVDTQTGAAVGQYAYKLESAAQGRGISALVALGNDKFMILERNNRGIGVGATLAGADKNVFLIDLAAATDVTGLNLPATGAFAGALSKGAKVIDLDANTLAALGNQSPEKWEGLAIGPQLASGQYLVLAGTDNDYSVTQNATGAQFDVYYRFSNADPFASSIQCPAGQTAGCFLTANNATAATLGANDQLLPGVLHAYTATIDGYVSSVPEPQAVLLMLAGLLGVGIAARPRH